MKNGKLKSLFDETLEVFAAIIASERFSPVDNVRERLVTLGDMTSEFFAICTLIRDYEKGIVKTGYKFEHQIMAHSIYCELHRNNSTDISLLNFDNVVGKFVLDATASQLSIDNDE